MANYTTIKTNYGLSLEAAAQAAGAQISLTQMAIGDGGGNPVTPGPGQTGLVREVFRVALNAIAQSTEDATQFTAEAIIPADSGGYTMREAGLFTSDGSLFAVANLPSVYKPNSSEGAFGQVVVTMTFKAANADDISLSVDENVSVATRLWVQNYVTPAHVFPGGQTAQVLAKTSNADGDWEWADASAAVKVLVDTVEEDQVLSAGQTVVNLGIVTTEGLAVFKNGVRLEKTDWTQTSATSLTLAIAGNAGDKIALVQNEQTGYTDVLRGKNNLSDVADRVAALSNIGGLQNSNPGVVGSLPGTSLCWDLANSLPYFSYNNGASGAVIALNSSLQSAVSTLQTNINNEATTRANAVAGLQSQINVRVSTNATDDGINSPVTALRYGDGPGVPWLSVARSSGSFNTSLVQTNPGSGFYQVTNLTLNAAGQPIYVSSGGGTTQGITTFSDANTTMITQAGYQHTNDYLSFNASGSWILGATQSWTAGQIANEATARANTDAGLQSQINARVATRPSDDGVNSPISYLAYYDGNGIPWLNVAKSSGSFNSSLVQTNAGSGFYQVANLTLNSTGQPIFVRSGGGTSQAITTFNDANTNTVSQIGYQHTNDYLSFNASGSWILGATQSWTAGQIANEATTRANTDAGLQSQINKRSAGTGSNNGFNYSWIIVDGVMTLSFTFENDNTGSAQTIQFPKAFGGTATSVVVISMTKDNDVWVWNFGQTSFQMQTPNGGTNTFSCIAMGAAP